MCSLHDDDDDFLQQHGPESGGGIDLAATRHAQEALASQTKQLLEAFSALNPELHTRFLSLMRLTAKMGG